MTNAPAQHVNHDNRLQVLVTCCQLHISRAFLYFGRLSICDPSCLIGRMSQLHLRFAHALPTNLSSHEHTCAVLL